MKQLIAILTLVGVLGWGVVSAQDTAVELTEIYTSPPDKIVIFYPTGWTATPQPSFVQVASPSITIDFYTDIISQRILDLNANNYDASLRFFLETLDIPDDDPDRTTEITLDDETYIAVSVTEGSQGQFAFLATNNQDDEMFVFIHVQGATLDLLAEQDTILAIIASFGNLLQPEDGSSAPTNTQSQTASNAAPAVACTIRVASGERVDARVGPGRGRGLLGSAVLALSVDIPVLGQNTDADGISWWQLDKRIAIPNTSANEVWVEQSQVTTSGDCDLVGAAAAPRIIRSRPTQAPSAASTITPPQSASTPVLPPTPSNSNDPYYVIYADPDVIFQNQCTTIYWYTENVSEVYFDGFPVNDEGQQTVCPQFDTDYELRVVLRSGAEDYIYTTVFVDPITFCSFSDIPFEGYGTLGNVGVDRWEIAIDPCETPFNVYVEMVDDFSGIDPYIDVYIDGQYYGSDDDGSGSLDSTLFVQIPAGATTLQIDAYDLTANGGDYIIYVVYAP